MRLGGYYGANSIAELPALCEKLDACGLSAIAAPDGFHDRMSIDACAAYGAAARDLGLVVGEFGAWANLMHPDERVQSDRIANVRRALVKADAMGCLGVVSLVGTQDPSDHPLAPSAFLFTKPGETAFYDVVMRILDGLDLATTHFIIEPWHNTFFYQPGPIRAFIDRVDHPRFGLHLDQMNMIDHAHYYHTTELINETFDLLSDKIVSVHLKDLRCDSGHMFLKWDEVDIGDGVMDYETYLCRLAALSPDTPCYCEHMPREEDYTRNFARLHDLAAKAGVSFLRRGQTGPAI